MSGLAGRLGDHRRLFDSIAALGLMIAFYYGLTGFACTIYYRHELFSSVKAFFLIGVGPPLIIGLGFLVMGALLMLWWRFGHPAFFRRKPEVADPALVRRVGLDD